MTQETGQAYPDYPSLPTPINPATYEYHFVTPEYGQQGLIPIQNLTASQRPTYAQTVQQPRPPFIILRQPLSNPSPSANNPMFTTHAGHPYLRPPARYRHSLPNPPQTFTRLPNHSQLQQALQCHSPTTIENQPPDQQNLPAETIQHPAYSPVSQMSQEDQESAIQSLDQVLHQQQQPPMDPLPLDVQIMEIDQPGPSTSQPTSTKKKGRNSKIPRKN
jgi:hypothetical protein